MTFTELSLPDHNKPTNNPRQMPQTNGTTISVGHGAHDLHPTDTDNNSLKPRRSHAKLHLHLPHSMAGVKENYFVQALSQTTLSFCQETTLHGMKYIVQDIQELGGTYSRY